MGQNSSRLQEQTSSPAPEVNSSTPPSISGASSDFQPLDASTDGSHSSQSRRSSLRKSLLKLVKPLSIRNRVNGDATNPSDARRSWRNSRRWSKAHNPVIREESHGPGPSERGSPITEPSDLPCHSGKGKQREITPSLQENEDHATAATLDESGQLPYPLSSFDPDLPSTSVETSSVVADSSTLSSLHIGNDAQEDSHMECGSDATSQHSSAAPGEDTEGTPSAQPIPQTSAAPSSLHRQFPPPGTLVVVQGIVHTTDVSRPNATPPVASAIVANAEDAPTPQSSTTIDTPSDQSTPRSRNRLSALLRPRSSSRPVSTVIGDPTTTTTVTATSTSQTESTPLTGSDSHMPPEETTVALNSSEATQTTSPEPPPVVENRAPLISSSSIDVLGTLLRFVCSSFSISCLTCSVCSVAAAATAASLLTGSSEPILSSGLAPPHPSIPSSRVPQSTVPNTSMPNLPSYGSPPDNAGFPDVSTAGRSERMRQAWGTIRERLGLRPSTSPTDDGITNHRNQDVNNSDSASNMSAVDGVELGTPIDTRELMLAEMARTFNIGLGLNGLGGLAPGSNPASGHTDRDAAGNANNSEESRASTEDSQTRTTLDGSNVTLPPEGSFERFLVDLQVDLRVALTRPDNDSEPEGHQSPPLETESQPVGSLNGINNFASPPSTTSPSAGERTLLPTGAVNLPSGGDSDHASFNEVRDDYVDMPLLRDVSDSGSESEDGDNADYADDG